MNLPGSPEAMNAGCKCSPSDNHKGRGNWRDGRSYSVSVECRMHWAKPDDWQMSLFGGGK